MMKKILVLLVVLAMAAISSMAFAADISVSGEVDIRSRNFDNLDFNKNIADNAVDTQERVRLEVNVKSGDVKGKVSIENDYDTWGRNEAYQADATTTSTTPGIPTPTFLKLREAWMLFPVPNTPVFIKGGHMLLQLGDGWFYRAMKYGSDAWVAFADIDALHLGIVDVKVSEGLPKVASDDVDFYVLVGNYKLGESSSAGINITQAAIRPSRTDITNVGLNYGGKAGPATLKAELDIQNGKTKGAGATADISYSGYQIVAQGTLPMNALTLNATIAMGSGDKSTTADKNEGIITVLDSDKHYTLLYEYKIKTAAGGLFTGFANTTALEVGAMFAATKNLSVGADIWMLQASQKTNVSGDAAAALSTAVGTEIDANINWKLADNLSWNWTLGYFTPGAVYKNSAGVGKDSATGIQGVLAMKF